VREFWFILRTRLRVANNSVASAGHHVLVHLAVFLGIVVFLVGGGTAFFHLLFSFLEDQEEFGTLLANHLVSMVLMVFVSMLIFSNLIITLATTYMSREIAYYMSMPVRHASIFFVKLFESTIYSSWAFAILSLPLFISFGIVREVSISFYLMIPVLILPFLFIPATIGALITMILSACLPARRTLKWSIALVALSGIVALAVWRLSGKANMLMSGDLQSFTQVMGLLKIGQHLWLPHMWVSQAMIELSTGNWRGFFYWYAIILANTMMLLQICAWLAPRLYYRGWCLARESSSVGDESHTRLGRHVFDRIERLFVGIRPSIRALVMKDIKTFWRDPAQWSQLIILFGLLFIYIANLRSGYVRNRGLEVLLPFWQALISLFNLGATCFVLSILTTRFVYPMLSLEGKQYWVVGLAPIRRTSVVWEKYWLSLCASLLITESLMIFSNWILHVKPFVMIVSTLTLLLMSFGLTSLSVGLGAMTPNFKDDNPARIANGLGGTLNVIISLFYIALTIAIEIYPVFMITTHRMIYDRRGLLILSGSIVASILLHTVAIAIPLRMGLRQWRKIEF
jgi:ABC-2 type transport system permease protein